MLYVFYFQILSLQFKVVIDDTVFGEVTQEVAKIDKNESFTEPVSLDLNVVPAIIEVSLVFQFVKKVNISRLQKDFVWCFSLQMKCAERISWKTLRTFPKISQTSKFSNIIKAIREKLCCLLQLLFSLKGLKLEKYGIQFD